MKRVSSYGQGDHYVHIKVVIPKKLTDQQKALIQVNRKRITFFYGFVELILFLFELGIR